MERVTARGFKPGNIDIIIHAEQPKMTPHKRRIAESVAHLTSLPAESVSVKAKTNEGLGPLGQAGAIACTAVVGLVAVA